MTSAFLRTTAAFALVSAVAIAPAAAQRQQATPEQRIQRLEDQVRQVQRRVFPKGQPADTAGIADEPAATQASVQSLDDRLGALERQLAQVLRASEENAHQLSQMQADITRLRSDQEQRLQALENAVRSGAIAAPVQAAPTNPASSSPASVPPRQAPTPVADAAESQSDATPAVDPAEAAYNEGFHLWQDKKYDAAIASLRATASSFPNSRWVSWANNLAGRAMLDKGDARPAATALLANYRADPQGGRAQDSLFYLGQALMKLNQPSQACNAYGELESVYAGSVRGELQRMLPAAKKDAGCS